MHPAIHLNSMAIIAAIVAYMALGSLWYGPLFGGIWRREMKVPPDAKPDAGVMRRALVLMLIATFLTVFVLAHEVQIWRPSVWRLGPDAPSLTYGFYAGFFVWLGFFVPALLSQVAWENKSWKLFAINAGYYFVGLQLVGAILACWR